MRLLLASSANGYLARGPEDDMKWTGPIDKAIFRLLTLSNANDTLLAGSRTFDQMPKLPGRKMERLSGDGLTLDLASRLYPDAWLIGGPTVALQALKLGLVRRAFICVSPVELEEGMHATEIERLLPNEPAYTIKVSNVDVLVYTEDQQWPGK